MIIHVTNTLTTNGTSIHWHGLRQMNNTEHDGVPGVTQCPIAPGQTYTYKMQATQYGSVSQTDLNQHKFKTDFAQTWYHSHFFTQYGDGLMGGMIINGPATANYDVDLGNLVLNDWSHVPTSELWDAAKLGAPPTLDTGLINGTNTWNGLGKKFQTTFIPGKKYLIRLVNTAVDAHFQFSIDGHNLTVIANDLVPLVPYTTQSVRISMGQRYDIVVTASQTSGNFWMRTGWLAACSVNANPANITGIVRYGASTADPTSVSTVVTAADCGDEPYASLVPHLAKNVGTLTAKSVTLEDLSFAFTDHFTWTINSSTLVLDWDTPTIIDIFNDVPVFPTSYNVVALNGSAATWAVYVIQDLTGIGLFHPIHMHGHDFYVVGQEVATFSLATANLNLVNPPRRDVATLPGNGYLAIAFQLDNPGSWLLHCHIAWHASEGLSMQFVENESEIALGMTNEVASEANCASWQKWSATMPFPQDDSGI